MKKIFLALFSIFMFTAVASAQNKTAYLDVYARGGALNLNITVSFCGDNISYGSTNLGVILNELGQKGWVMDESIVIPRHNMWSMVTRHKLHIIMKKEYKDGENPFDGLKKTKKPAPQKEIKQKKSKTSKKK